MKKNEPSQIQISDFQYTLPDEKIAKYPLARRDASKLLLYDGGCISTERFSDLDRFLPADTLLVFNNTRVVHARLLFRKQTGAVIEVFCLSPCSPSDYVLNFQQRSQCSWHCMVGNAKRWRGGELEMTVGATVLKARLAEKNDDGAVVEFSWDNTDYTFSELLEQAGKLPIPPYLNRASEAKDDETYQTVYSRVEGSVAAPTAGLHFTDAVLDKLRKKGVRTADVTLHVGAGTFRPVKSETIGGHAMHTEFFVVSRQTIQAMLDNGGKLVAVGTTSVRTIESLYYIGKKIAANPYIAPHELAVEQWEPYDGAVPDILPREALRHILDYLDRTGQEQLLSATRIIIVPGYRFRYADGLVTNFHQPESTLLLLVSAFVGDDWRKIYDYALQNNYRFLSYGDGSLLWGRRMIEVEKI